MNVTLKRTQHRIEGCTLTNEAIYRPQPSDELGNMETISTHGIVDGRILKIIERGNYACDLEDGNSYWKDNNKNDVKVTWIRIHVIDYDGIDFATW